MHDESVFSDVPMRQGFWNKTNCTIVVPSPSNKKVGRSSVTRRRVFQKGSPSIGSYRAFLQEAGKPVHNLAEGADETKESLIGYFPKTFEWPDTLSNKAIVNVNFDCGTTYRAQVIRGVYEWVDDLRKGRKKARRRTGERLYLAIVREAEA